MNEQNILPYETTGCYSLSRQILILITQIAGNLPKLIKFSLGAQLYQTAATIIQGVSLAYLYSRNDIKIQYLEISFQNMILLRTNIRVAKDFNSISVDQYVKLLGLLEDLNLQLIRWIAKLNGNHPLLYTSN